MKATRFACGLLFLVLVVCLLLVLAACGGDNASSGTTATSGTEASSTTTSTAAKPTKTAELKIGGSVPLSGPPSASGLALQEGWGLAFDDVNAAGGIVVGDTAYTVNLMVEDSKASAEGATTAANKLCLQEGVKFMMGDIADFLIAPLYKVTSAAGALLFETTVMNAKDIPGNTAEVGPDKPLLIRAAPASSELDILDANYLVKSYPNAKKVALIALSFPDFDTYKDVLTTKWAPLGLTIGAYERIAVDTVDFVPVITRILQDKPDCIDVMRCAMAQFPMIIKTARDQGFTGPIMYGQPTDIMYAKLAGDNTTDVFGTGLYMDAPNLPEAAAKAIAEGRAKYGEDLVSDSILAYDQAMLLVQMIEKAQSVDPTVVEKTFETLTNPGDLQSIFGPAYAGGLKTTGVNHVLVKPWPLSRLMNGQGELVGLFTVDIP